MKTAAIAAIAAAVLSLAPHIARAQTAVDIAVLQTKVENIETAIFRVDATLAAISETLIAIKEANARTDEKVNSTRELLFTIFVPLHLLTLTALFGLLTKGVLWGKEPRPQSTRRTGDSPLQPAATRV